MLYNWLVNSSYIIMYTGKTPKTMLISICHRKKAIYFLHSDPKTVTWNFFNYAIITCSALPHMSMSLLKVVVSLNYSCVTRITWLKTQEFVYILSHLLRSIHVYFSGGTYVCTPPLDSFFLMHFFFYSCGLLHD